MANGRKNIREKLHQALLGKTDAGNRVFVTRTRAVWEDELPCIAVYTEGETVEIFSEAPREYRRSLKVSIECYADAKDNLDDVLDTLASQVEDAMELDDSLAGTVNATTLQGTEFSVIDQGRKLTGSARLTFNVDYFTKPQPTVPVPLTGASIDWDADGMQAQDTVTFGG